VAKAVHVLVAMILFGFASAAMAQDRPRVVVVNYALQYFAERLLDDTAEVVFLAPRGTDPSFWRPSISDISTVQAADLILLNGAGFASWVDRVSLPRSRLVNTSKDIEGVFIVTESITHSHGDGGEHSHEGLASYTWLDPMLAIAQAEAIATAVVRRGLAQAEEIEPRLDALRADLTDLDASAQAALDTADGIAIIATHPRYQYFARRYGLSLTSLEWEAGAAPTDDERADLQALVEQTGAKLLLWEAEPPQTAIKNATGLGLASVVFDPLAQTPADQSFMDVFSQAVADLSAAVQAASEQ